jgi:hypothetical protein
MTNPAEKAGARDRPFYFIETPIELSVDLPIDVDDGIRLRKLTAEEAEDVFYHLDVFWRGGAAVREPYCFTCERQWGDDGTSFKFFHNDLAFEHWKVYALERSDDAGYHCHQVQSLCRLTSLLSPTLRSGLSVTPNGGGAWHNRSRPAYWASEFKWMPQEGPVDDDYIRSWRLLNQQQKTVGPGHFEHVFKLFSSTEDVLSCTSPRGPVDDMYTLSLFAVLEAALTHRANGRDDAISRQLGAKMKLLQNRFSKQLDYSFFGGNDIPSVWKALYNARSEIAHGGSRDRLAEMRSANKRLDEFLRRACQAVLRQMLIEPELLHDLRNC